MTKSNMIMLVRVHRIMVKSKCSGIIQRKFLFPSFSTQSLCDPMILLSFL